MRRGLFLTLACLFVLLASAARAEGCTCVGPGSPCAAFGMASAVFVGTVSEVTRPKRGADGNSTWPASVARFVVEEAFAGVDAAEVSVGGGSGADCGYGFEKGKRYLVYAGRTQSGGLYASLCSRTAKAQEAVGDIEFLRALVRQPPGGTISGGAGRALREVDERGMWKVVTVEGVRVTVAGRDGLREVHIDDRGRYKLTGLPPGSYEVMAHLPERLTVWQPRRRVKVVERGCAAADFYVIDDGRIGGRVLDAEGNPVPRVAVTLKDVDNSKSDYLFSAKHAPTDKEGRYKFSAIPPGRYLLGVRLSPHTSADDPAAVFPRTYYPGVAGVPEAEVIELKAGEELTLRDMRLPPRLAGAVVRVRVVWGNGAPVAGATVFYRETTYEDRQSDEGRAADEQGQFEIKTGVGAVFQMRAETLLPPRGDPSDKGSPARSEPQTVSVTSPVETVTLVITKSK